MSLDTACKMLLFSLPQFSIELNKKPGVFSLIPRSGDKVAFNGAESHVELIQKLYT